MVWLELELLPLETSRHESLATAAIAGCTTVCVSVVVADCRFDSVVNSNDAVLVGCCKSPFITTLKEWGPKRFTIASHPDYTDVGVRICPSFQHIFLFSLVKSRLFYFLGTACYWKWLQPFVHHVNCCN